MAVTVASLPGGWARRRRARPATSANNGLKVDSMNPASGGDLAVGVRLGPGRGRHDGQPGRGRRRVSAARPGETSGAGGVMAGPITSAVFAPPNAALRLSAYSGGGGQRLAQHEVEAAAVVGAEEPGVDREHALAGSQQGDDQLQHAGRLQGLAVQRLGGADRHGAGRVAEREPQRVRLGRVALAGARPVGVDVAEILRRDTGPLQRRRDRPGQAMAFRVAAGTGGTRRRCGPSRPAGPAAAPAAPARTRADSTTTAPTPSPSSSPRRPALNGRTWPSRASTRPASNSANWSLSTRYPPATTTRSAWPRAIIAAASAIAVLAATQADV